MEKAELLDVELKVVYYIGHRSSFDHLYRKTDRSRWKKIIIKDG